MGAMGELMEIIAHIENVHIINAKWLDQDDVDLSGIRVPQDYDNNKSVPMLIIKIEEHLTFEVGGEKLLEGSFTCWQLLTKGRVSKIP